MTAICMGVLMVVGSIVRSTNSGLACPDWPLCQGCWIPPLEPHVWIEWFHRLLALVLGLLLLATALVVWTRHEVRARLGLRAVAAIGLYLTQALLGALTVWKLLSPHVVSSHLAVALLLFGVLLTLTLDARAAAARGSDAAAAGAGGSDAATIGPVENDAVAARPSSPRTGLLTLALVWTWAQAILGAMVSSSHAGCVCPDWPTCNGRWFPPLSGLVGLQMMHRFSAYGLLVGVAAAAVSARGAADAAVRRGALMAVALVAAQIALGVGNVFMGTPVWLSALHLATAVALFATLLITRWRARAMPIGARA